jgi:hypothetical protein
MGFTGLVDGDLMVLLEGAGFLTALLGEEQDF